MTTDRAHTVVDSPIGPLTLVSDGGHLVGCYMADQKHRPDETAFGDRDDSAAPFEETRRQLAEYFAGERTEFDLPLAPVGTEFQRLVWTALRRIPYGQTWSYGRLATEVGNAKASRAVGLANGRNPLCVVVPCHRVVGASGSLTGFAGGIERKKTLLHLESSHGT